MIQGQVEGRHVRLSAQHHEDVGQAAGEGFAQHHPDEMTADPLVIGLHSQEEGGHADGQGRDHAEMERHHGIRPIGEECNNGQTQGEDILHQEQGGGSLDIVDDPAAFAYDTGHGGKIRIQQHQLGHLAGSLGTAGHGDAAVGFLHGQNVIDTVAGHGNGMFLLFQRPDQLLFLVRGHTAEDGVIVHRVEEIGLILQGGGIDVIFRTPDACPLGDFRNGYRIIAGNDLDSHALLGKVFKGFRCFRTDPVGQQHQSQGL